ncbi:hypothetical protein BT96DRAFT_677793 [Gymnopus androsaceus JB14]|uniref:Uncharacterized protein n=1 Tax=Gymnopus androsaceus JB14 TaxID=1447944 RepID=A0A6A4GFV4_9AGAR|nr:hypothetical protein BT96DRAFT_677793 [Gymnopus androsaceus JB14]
MQAPQPMQPPASSSASASSQEEEPSLVTQLQQMHGLTKQKFYGSKPKRRPFVSAEIYREHPRKASSLSPVSTSDTNHGGRVTSPSLIDRSARVYHQNGRVPVLPHPRSLLDIRSSGSMSERDPVSSYPTTRMPVSSPSSPVLNHPPSHWNTPTSVSSQITCQQQQHQQHPISLTSSRSQPSPYTTATTLSSTYSTKSNPETGLTEGPLISHGDRSTPNSPAEDSRFHQLKSQTQNSVPSMNSMALTGEYSIPSSSVYREELLSHLRGPSVSPSHGATIATTTTTTTNTATGSSQPFITHARSSYSDPNSYVRANPYPPSSSQSQSKVPCYAACDSYDSPVSNQIGVISPYGMAAGPSTVSSLSHPSSPISSGSSSLTGWAG